MWLIQVSDRHKYFIKIKGYPFFPHGGSTSNARFSRMKIRFFTAFSLLPKVLGIYNILLGLNIQVADV